MLKNIKKEISLKLHKLQLILNTPDAYKARKAGCPLNLYSVLYRLRNMGINPNTILDIGANRGLFSRCANYVYPHAMIYAFEPLKDCYQKLQKLKNTIAKFECYNIALGEKSEETTIYKSDFDESSSLLKMGELHKEAYPHTSNISLEKTEVHTLDNILANKNLETPILMKIDTQGYEKFILNGANQILKKTDYVICELSFKTLYKGQPLFDDIYIHLRNAKFCFHGELEEHSHPKTLEKLQIDGLFIKESLNLQ